MRRLLTVALLLTLPLFYACSKGDGENSKVTQTRMNDIDSVEGTISDDMINTDESTEQAPVDAAPAPVAKVAKKVEKADKPTDAVASPTAKAAE
jgi:hypothetical protein